MCSHYLVEPTACTPAAGWEKGQVENQVGNTREQLFTPRLRFQTLAELNGWLADRCIADAKTAPHPEFKDRTIWEVFEAERRALIGYPGPFDGFHETDVSVSKTAWSASTATATAWRTRRLGRRYRSMPTPTAS